MKASFAVVALLVSAHVLAADKRVFLDSPGALDTLQRENPAHFVKVERILREAPRLPVSSVQNWIRVQFDARDVTAPFLMRTSYPAQADISFVLDDTRYHARIRLDAPAKPIPAKPK